MLRDWLLSVRRTVCSLPTAYAGSGPTPIFRIYGSGFYSLLVSLVGAVVFNDRLLRAVSPETVPWYKVTTSG